MAGPICLPRLGLAAQDGVLDQQLFEAVGSLSTSASEIERLVAQDADPNARGQQQITPLVVAAINDNPRGAKALLAAGARIGDRAEGGATALMLAARGDEIGTAASVSTAMSI